VRNYELQQAGRRGGRQEVLNEITGRAYYSPATPQILDNVLAQLLDSLITVRM